MILIWTGVLDRIGGGDGFVDGLLYGILRGRDVQNAQGSAGPAERLRHR